MTDTTLVEAPFWWPLDLSPRAQAALDEFRRQQQRSAVTLDASLNEFVADLLARLMGQYIASIIERDSLPHLGHVLNGWGNAQFRRARMMDHLESFIQTDSAGRDVITQCDPEGEFHPWQSIAYAVMAGVDPDEPITRRITLRHLARNSRYLHTREGHELGHLLFALAYLDPDVESPPFSLAGDLRTVPELMELAVEAHHYGSFEVCRKFHLTEGLCAMAAKVAGLETYRTDAQGFLDGQLDMLLVLGIILREAEALAAAGQPAEPDSLMQELREALVLGNYLENHCYYAGHLIELATLAESLGYRIAPEHRNATAFVLNEMNRVLPAYLPHLYFPECFLHLGHYRRAMTLLAETERLSREGRPPTRADLARFTVDFDALPASEGLAQPDKGLWSSVKTDIYAVASFSVTPRAGFESVIDHYRALAPHPFRPRGTELHFRRIIPPRWPRAFHYELLDYSDAMGLELHLEDERVGWLRDRVQPLVAQVAALFPEQRVEWEPKWAGELGRLRVLFALDAPPAQVAAGMLALIEETYPKLDVAVREAVRANGEDGTR